MGCPKHREHIRNKLMAKAARKQAWIDSQVQPSGPPKLMERPTISVGDSYYLAGYVDSPAGTIAKYVRVKPHTAKAPNKKPTSRSPNDNRILSKRQDRRNNRTKP